MCAFETRGQANVVGTHNLPIPTTGNVLFLELAKLGHPFLEDGLVGAVFNSRDLSQWRQVSSPDSVFCAGHTLTAAGTLVIVGGHVAYNATARLPGQPAKVGVG
jgi:hypothetical protein